LNADKSSPPFPDTQHFIANTSFPFEAFIHGSFDHPFKGGIQAGAVTAAGQHADSAFFHGNHIRIIESVSSVVKDGQAVTVMIGEAARRGKGVNTDTISGITSKRMMQIYFIYKWLPLDLLMKME
jgi:hypothetical protein